MITKEEPPCLKEGKFSIHMKLLRKRLISTGNKRKDIKYQFRDVLQIIDWELYILDNRAIMKIPKS